VVTGGGTGIGLAIARELADAGAKVTLMARNQERVQAQAAQLAEQSGVEAQGVQVDVSDEASVKSAFATAVKQFGPINILVNNAGVAESAPFAKTSLASWQKTMDVNATGVFLCCQQVISGMVEAGWGRIVTVASTAGLKGYRYVTAYVASKHAVIGLTRALALELARKGVTVNAVCPGYTDTDIVASSLQNIVAKTGQTEAQALQALTADNPQARLVKPAEVATAVGWLCGAGSDAITGQAISVSGGEVM